MEMQSASEGRTIGNVGVLDIRNATAASVGSIASVGNIGLLLYSRETAPLVAGLKMRNLGGSIEVPAGARLLNGVVTVSRDFLKTGGSPLDLVINGQLVVEPDVTAEDIAAGLGSLYLSGQIICPEGVLGALQAKAQTLNGKTISYPAGSQLVLGSLVLDESRLNALGDGSALTVTGDLSVPKVLPAGLIERKLRQLQVMGQIRCPEENAAAIQARLRGAPHVQIIPAGAHLVEGPLVLDRFVLEALPSPRLYCTERVEVAPDVDAGLLDARLESLTAAEMVICPVALGSVLGRKTDVLKTRVVLYEGELWVVDGEETLGAARFEFLEGKLTLVVTGELTVEATLDPKLLAARLAKVHNLGEIHCTPVQMAAFQARLGIAEGEMVDANRERAEEHDLGNVGYLVL
jgi:hypothetical protein